MDVRKIILDGVDSILTDETDSAALITLSKNGIPRVLAAAREPDALPVMTLMFVASFIELMRSNGFEEESMKRLAELVGDAVFKSAYKMSKDIETGGEDDDEDDDDDIPEELTA